MTSLEDLKEETSLYKSGNAPTHPFAYRVIAKDFNNDGMDDLFLGSMGIQVRGEDYTQNYIEPYPHLLLLSVKTVNFVERSSKILSTTIMAMVYCVDLLMMQVLEILMVMEILISMHAIFC